ncbi:MAG: DUF3572 family protein [Kordiimonadaceae bacterium]|nr:DUF3572 family protein [Kordiimonadaceae bacterium]
MDKNRADIIAINCLSFIAADEKYLAGYLNLTGTDIYQLKKNTENPDEMPSVLASILDFLLQNENYLIEFSKIYEIDPADIQKARRLFPGADLF